MNYYLTFYSCPNESNVNIVNGEATECNGLQHEVYVDEIAASENNGNCGQKDKAEMQSVQI